MSRIQGRSQLQVSEYVNVQETFNTILRSLERMERVDGYSRTNPVRRNEEADRIHNSYDTMREAFITQCFCLQTALRNPNLNNERLRQSIYEQVDSWKKGHRGNSEKVTEAIKTLDAAIKGSLRFEDFETAHEVNSRSNRSDRSMNESDYARQRIDGREAEIERSFRSQRSGYSLDDRYQESQRVDDYGPGNEKNYGNPRYQDLMNDRNYERQRVDDYRPGNEIEYRNPIYDNPRNTGAEYRIGNSSNYYSQEFRDSRNYYQ
jgi:hypothetical protein